MSDEQNFSSSLNLFLGAGVTFFGTYVLLQGIQWFLYPLGMPHITYFHAWGLWITIQLLCSGLGDNPDVEKPNDEIAKGLLFKGFGLLIIWGFMYLASLGV